MQRFIRTAVLWIGIVILMTSTALASPEGWEEYLAQGKEAAGNGQHPLAIELFSKAIELNPDNPELYIRRGISYGLNKGDGTNVIQIDPAENRALSSADFQKAYSLDPGNKELEQAIAEAQEFVNQLLESTLAIDSPEMTGTGELNEPEKDPDLAEGTSFDVPVEYETSATTYDSEGRVSRQEAYDSEGRVVYRDVYVYGGQYQPGYDVVHYWIYYDNNQISRMEYASQNNTVNGFYDNSPYPYEWDEFEYGSNGELARINFYNRMGALTRIDYYESGKVVKREKISSDGVHTVTEY